MASRLGRLLCRSLDQSRIFRARSCLCPLLGLGRLCDLNRPAVEHHYLEEQQSGLINHPLQLVITYTKGPGGSVFARPAQRSDGWVEHPDPPPPAPAASIPKGVCFRLPASLNLDAMPMEW